MLLVELDVRGNAQRAIGGGETQEHDARGHAGLVHVRLRSQHPTEHGGNTSCGEACARCEEHCTGVDPLAVHWKATGDAADFLPVAGAEEHTSRDESHAPQHGERNAGRDGGVERNMARLLDVEGAVDVVWGVLCGEEDADAGADGGERSGDAPHPPVFVPRRGWIVAERQRTRALGGSP